MFELPEEETPLDANAWMATFADMMTLLLTFFVLLLSFANTDVTKFRMVLGSVKDALGVKYKHPGDVEGVATNPIEFSEKESGASPAILDSDPAFEKMKAMLYKEGLDSMVELEANVRGIIVRVKGRVLYNRGSATLRHEASAVLDGIGRVAQLVESPMLVEGHTDNRPINTGAYASNWELSTARAIAAMRYLVAHSKLDPRRVGVTGYADTRPLGPNDNKEQRGRNRRVEFVFVRTLKRNGRQTATGKAPAPPSEPTATPTPTPTPTPVPARPTVPEPTPAPVEPAPEKPSTSRPDPVSSFMEDLSKQVQMPDDRRRVARPKAKK